MSNREKFEGLKQEKLDENEKIFGAEIRSLYGDETIEKANKAFLKMEESDMKKWENLNREIEKALQIAVATKNPTGEKAQHVVALHQAWITMSWGVCNPEAYKNLVSMYETDERFKQYYDDIIPGGTAFLRDAVNHFIVNTD